MLVVNVDSFIVKVWVVAVLAHIIQWLLFWLLNDQSQTNPESIDCVWVFHSGRPLMDAATKK